VNHWIGRALDGTYGIIVDTAIFDRICDDADEIETGGVLVGYYTEDRTTAIVTEVALPPPDSKSGKTWFHRGRGGLRRLFAQRWEARQRTYYLGEWHYHPATDIEPSGDDLSQMLKISMDSRYQCSEPIMLIVGRPLIKGMCPARAFVFPRGEHFKELVDPAK